MRNYENSIRKARKIIYTIFSVGLGLVPLVALAQSQPRNLTDLIGRFVEIFNALIPLLFGVALIGFLWGVAQFILQADNEEKRKEGRQIMIWGIIGLFVMTAVWGIIIIIGGTFGVRFLERPQSPQLQGTKAPYTLENYFGDFKDTGSTIPSEQLGL